MSLISILFTVRPKEGGGNRGVDTREHPVVDVGKGFVHVHGSEQRGREWGTKTRALFFDLLGEGSEEEGEQHRFHAEKGWGILRARLCTFTEGGENKKRKTS